MSSEDRLRELASRYLPGGFESAAVFKGQLRQKWLERFDRLSEEPLSFSYVNQVLHLSHQPGIGPGFFAYYFLKEPPRHPYNLDCVLATRPDLHPAGIHSFAQLEWGMKRFVIDALLYYGDVSTAFSHLAQLSYNGIESFFASKALDPDGLKARGPFLRLEEIPIDDRYLIAELACKAYDPPARSDRAMVVDRLTAAYEAVGSPKRFTVRSLLDQPLVAKESSQNQLALKFAVEEIMDEPLETREDLISRLGGIAERFARARVLALINTDIYLSLVSDLDVYVATSMRNRQDFRDMANYTRQIFDHPDLRSYRVRYFDPTLSACAGHEDKGIIECLMVKCAKALIYFAGENESFGKDAEAAMALSQGKPVIIVCPDTDRGHERMRFFRDIHPLSRMIDMATGVPVGAMTTTSVEEVVQLLHRLFTNGMEYDLDHDGAGYYRLKERITHSVVRLQTSTKLLRETFWNYYHGLPPR